MTKAIENQLLSITEKLQKVDSKLLFANTIDEFMDEVWAERERRLLQWSKEKRSQRWIAKETGCAQQTISNWQQRFGIESSQPKRQSDQRVVTSSNNFNHQLEKEAAEAVERIKSRNKHRSQPVYEELPPTPKIILAANPLKYDITDNFYPLLNASNFEHLEDEDLDELQELLELLTKVVANLKSQLKRRDYAAS